MELTDDLTRTVYATDNSIYQVRPSSVVLPAAAADVAELLRRNFASDQPRPVVPRGAGTGTNGQSLTDGVVVDLKRRLGQLVSFDVEARTAVVEPGIVTAELNSKLAAHGLHWAPHTSTLNRCTVGGMIATDAAGKGSLVHGRTHRHVLALDVVLDDGSFFRAEPLPVEEAERRADEPGRSGQLWRALLDLPIAEEDTFDLPELARGFSGYGIDRVRRGGVIDPVPLLVGSEGTLGIVTSATLRLTPLPAHTLLIVASYPSFRDALTDALDQRSTEPTAIETFDEQTLEAGRASPAWPALGRVVGEHRGSVLLLEYTSDAPIDPDPMLASLRRTGRSVASAVLDDPAERADAWKVRADAVGLVAKVEVGAPERSARPTAMVEDCAVPVENMVEFIADFRSALDDFGLEYAMFGHADVGCVHVRPALDTIDPHDEQLVRTVTDRVVEIVAAHGGVLWGEHGRGFRGESVETFLTAEVIELMRRVKTAFDPRDVLNPGKLYRPLGAETPIVALDAAPLRGQQNRAVPVGARRHFDEAFACNGNGLCHHYAGSEVMCPSYKASRDPALSPKGRADLLREWLRRRADGDADLAAFEDGVAENLAACLSCSACTGRCPVEVDIPEMKSRFLESYYASRRRPLAQWAMGRFERLAGVVARVPRPLARLGAASLGRVVGLVDLPHPKPRVHLDLPTYRASDDAVYDVVLLNDVFSGVLDSPTLAAAGRVLRGAGMRVAVAPFVESGKYFHVKGDRTAFADAAAAQARLVNAIVAGGARPVSLEPATGLLHDHEYAAAVDGYPTGAVSDLSSVLLELRQKLPRGEGKVFLLGHCTERATRADTLSEWSTVLSAAGYEVQAPALGCCGMAGIFGHEREQQDLSRAIWNVSWASVVADAVRDGGRLLATGYSCRSQVERMARQQDVSHPVHLFDRR